MFSVVSGYALVSGVPERSPFSQAASRLHARLPKGTAQIWGADWNGLVGRDGEDTRFGMTERTTPGGRNSGAGCPQYPDSFALMLIGTLSHAVLGVFVGSWYGLLVRGQTSVDRFKIGEDNGGGYNGPHG